MLRKIMTTKLEVEPLMNRGVSDEGLSFVRRLLKIHPEERPTVKECCSDPWLAGEAESAKKNVKREDLRAPREVNQLPVDASSINLEGGEIDEDEGDEIDLDETLYKGPQVTKRLKREEAFAHGRERVEVPSSFDDSYSSLPHPANLGEINSSHGPHQDQQRKGNRLFGEVGASVLGSSGVISPNDLNLEGSIEGGRDSSGGMSEASTIERVTSPSSDLYQQQQQDVRLIRNRTDHPVMASTASSQQNSYLTENISPPRAGAATSLFGAESLVGHLNFTSPSPRASPTVDLPKSPLSLKTQESSPDSSFHSSMNQSHMPSEETESQDNADLQSQSQNSQAASASKKFIRRINLPTPDSYYWKPEDKSTHTAEYAAMMRAKDERAQRKKEAAQRGETSQREGDNAVAIEKHKQVKAPEKTTSQMSGQAETGMDGKSRGGLNNNKTSALPHFNAPTTHSRLTAGPTHGISSSAPAALSAPDGEKGNPSDKASINANPFKHPAKIYGRLHSTAESSLSITIPLNQRETCWGRGSDNTIVYPNGQDTRIPKYAFDIIFWRKDLRDDIEKGIAWDSFSDVKALIKTRATRKIWVNDIPLYAWVGKGNPFGQLYTGDKITVWKDEVSGKKIEFVCEFLHGLSERTRPKGVRFHIIDAADFKALKDKDDAESAASAAASRAGESQSRSQSPSVGFEAGGSQSQSVGGWGSQSPSQNSQNSVASSR